MTRIELVAHLAKRLPALDMNPLHVYCLVAPGSTGFVTALEVSRQTILNLRTCQRALVRLTAEGFLTSQAALPKKGFPGQPPEEYRLTVKGAALVAEILNLRPERHSN